ncbi:MAG: Wzz/FepE/Etk N-terminal domain-containing protein, partial [Candidatus Dormibacteraceae bacterium]
MQNTDPSDPVDPSRPRGPFVQPGAIRGVPAQVQSNGSGQTDHYGYGYGFQSHDQGAFARNWHFLVSKVWIVVLTTGVALGLGYAYIKHATVLFSATATVQAEQDQPSILRTQVMPQRDLQAVDYLQTIAQSFNSRLLLEHVADSCKLWNDPLFTNGLALATPFVSHTNLAQRFISDTNETPAHARFLDALDRIVKVSLRHGTRLIDITVTHRLPGYTALIANAIVNEYITQNAEREDTSIGLASKNLSKQAERSKKKLEQSENALQAYVQEHNAASLDERQNTVVDKLKELSTKATEAKAIRLKAET